MSYCKSNAKYYCGYKYYNSYIKEEYNKFRKIQKKNKGLIKIVTGINEMIDIYVTANCKARLDNILYEMSLIKEKFYVKVEIEIAYRDHCSYIDDTRATAIGLIKDVIGKRSSSMGAVSAKIIGYKIEEK